MKSAEQSSAKLPKLVRFRDLQAAGVASNWQSLQNMIDGQDAFPPGFLLSRNVRAWRLDDVLRWLDARPSERKEAPAALLLAHAEKQATG